MRRLRLGIVALTVIFSGSGCAGASPSFFGTAPGRNAAEVFNYDRFGAVSVYHGRGRPRDVVLLISGESGWDGAAVALAQRLADKGALVAGIDLAHYRAQLEKAPENCVSPASDLENLSHYLQSKFRVKSYLVPTLVGYASGATLVYSTLAEAPDGLFKGAISIGFCPGMDLKKNLCDNPAMSMSPRRDAEGVQTGVMMSPARQLPGKWIVLQGARDETCPVAGTQSFVTGVPDAELVRLPNVNHAYPVDGPWLTQYDAAYARLAAIHPQTKSAPLPAALADLPLTLVPASRSQPPVAGGAGQWFAVFLTGDGGWAGLDKGVSLELAKHDVPVVGWDSLKYFWTRRTPDGASRDLDRVVRYYTHAWGRSHVLLIGYSQGADTMPFMINRLPAETHDRVGYTALLGISDNALWEFHLATWLGSPAKGIPTAPELARWSGTPYLCIYGESDEDAACAQETGQEGTALKLDGGHHFGGSYSKIADEILNRLPRVSDEPVPPKTTLDATLPSASP